MPLLSNIKDLVSNPALYAEMVIDRLRNTNRGEKAVVNSQGAGMVPMTLEEQARGYTDAALDNLGGGGMGALGVVKPKGGNWLEGPLKNQLNTLRRQEAPYIHRNAEGWAVAPEYGQPMSAEETTKILADAASNPTFLQNKAHNAWIEGPLTKYVKTSMGTVEDPIRALAEQGILHISPGEVRPNMNTEVARKYAKGTTIAAKTPLAAAWENLADNAILQVPAKDFGPSKLAENPWLTKLNPDERVYAPLGIINNNLGFRHMSDELMNALRGDQGGLPRNLQLRPEQMQQLGIEKAVRHVAAINDWRAKAAAEANALRANNTAVQRLQEYPSGHHWIEFDPKAERKALEDALSYEGDTMGHCVGGYCDDVENGLSRIFSLRDAKGQPHVTIETRRSEPTFDDFAAKFPEMEQQTDEGYSDWIARLRAAPEYADFIMQPRAYVPAQIYGKANTSPKQEYREMIRDFLKSQGHDPDIEKDW